MRLAIRIWLALSIMLSGAVASAQTWQPSERQKEGAVLAAQSYMALLDQGNLEDALAMLAPSTRALLGDGEFQALKSEMRDLYGTVDTRRILAVNWYPRGGQEGTGVSAAVDFAGKTDKGALACGFLALQEMTEGVFLVTRDETTMLGQDEAAAMPRNALIGLLNRPGCRVFIKQ